MVTARTACIVYSWAALFVRNQFTGNALRIVFSQQDDFSGNRWFATRRRLPVRSSMIFAVLSAWALGSTAAVQPARRAVMVTAGWLGSVFGPRSPVAPYGPGRRPNPPAADAAGRSGGRPGGGVADASTGAGGDRRERRGGRPGLRHWSPRPAVARRGGRVAGVRLRTPVPCGRKVNRGPKTDPSHPAAATLPASEPGTPAHLSTTTKNGSRTARQTILASARS